MGTASSTPSPALDEALARSGASVF